MYREIDGWLPSCPTDRTSRLLDAWGIDSFPWSEDHMECNTNDLEWIDCTSN